MKLLDTSVAVDHLRGLEAASALLEGLAGSEEILAASELIRFELLVGMRPGEHDGLEAFCATLEWIPVTQDIVHRAAAYARSYRASHSGIGVVDYLLAGTAAEVGADLLTTNVRHFPMFEGLLPPYDYSD